MSEEKLTLASLQILCSERHQALILTRHWAYPVPGWITPSPPELDVSSGSLLDDISSRLSVARAKLWVVFDLQDTTPEILPLPRPHGVSDTQQQAPPQSHSMEVLQERAQEPR